jgi:hypothetical protein
MSGKPVERGDVYSQLHAKLGENLQLAFSDEASVQSVEKDIRLLPKVGAVLQGCALTKTQQEIAKLPDEIFADLVCAMYLASCGLDVPARMLLRRSLEVGVASLFLWDQPQTFWAWKEHDEDLSFKEMLERISSPKYQTFVKNENSCYDGGEIINQSSCNAHYRKFSNVMHGKISSFESLNPERFKHSPADWGTQLGDIRAVTHIVLTAWAKRIEKVAEMLRRMTE